MTSAEEEARKAVMGPPVPDPQLVMLGHSLKDGAGHTVTCAS